MSNLVFFRHLYRPEPFPKLYLKAPLNEKGLILFLNCSKDEIESVLFSVISF